ncbi:VCBS repeat-containing protein [Streptomyces lateritius]|uniref:VCBS repeat-containing protein n=1 Tax=Streptomyces lateritius TaxID=67313 RepID=UPI0016763AE8|nr:VCBS repeat-containing protein [Streptomyces lateritius]GGU11476.1 hypothetical protein GCM10010272_65900 [Streptomyces lateritius]
MALPVSAAVALPETATAAPAVTAGSDAQEPAARFEKAAFAEAARTGRRVEIIDRREETSEFFANPDGSTTRRSYATAKWTRFEGRWRQTDPTLIKSTDGSLTPAAPAFSIAFSGGGTQPLATMVKKGKKLALTWPTALPEPVLDGDTATYPSVLPGVDLKLTAEIDGFAQHLVVNTPEAAANPALRSIKLGVQTDGVSLTETADNKLLAKDEAGEIVFSAPGPKMWEQPAVAPEEEQGGAGTQLTGMSAMSADSVSESEAPDSAPVAADVTGSTLTLTPDAGLLASADQFPLVIDPIFSGGYREKWAVVYSATPSASYPNGSGWNSSTPADEPRVGFNGAGNTRSFFAMNTSGLHGATINSATFAVIQTHTWSCTASTAGPTELWSAKDITTTPTWSTQGSYWGSKLDDGSFAGGNDEFCPGDLGHDFTSTALTNYVQQAANGGWDPLVFGLRVPDSYLGNVNSFKRFRNNPVLEVNYNFKPTVNSHAAYEGSWIESGDGNKPVPCASAIGNSGIALTAKVSDRDGGKVTAIFHIKNSSGAQVTFAPNANWKSVNSGQWASVTMPAKNLVNGTYTWTVYAEDKEGPASAPTAACSFTVDRIGPNQAVTVRELDGSAADEDGTTTNPDNSPRPADKFPARKPITLRFTNTVADVTGYCWRMDHYVSVDGARCAHGTWVNAGTDASNTATVTVTPSGYPSSTLYVLAYDAAGNHSPLDGGVDAVRLSTIMSEFVYEPGTTPLTEGASHDRRGDLDGDGYADFVATDPNGKLLFYAGNGTLSSMAAARNIGTGGWGGALIAHRGDLQSMAGATAAADGYEDFLVRLSDKKLYLYPGNGLGSPWVYSRQELIHPSQSDWGGLRQMVMPGNIDGKPGNDLITVECVWDSAETPNCVNGALLLYSGNTVAGGGQDQTHPFNAEPTTLGTNGWRDFTNLAMDDLTGDGIGDLVGRNPADGKLYLYPGKITGTCPDTCTYSLGARSEYGSGGWNQRPYLTSPGNIQGTIKNAYVEDYEEDTGETTTYNFKQFEPTTGEEYGDFWATTPADSSTPVSYVDEAGNWTSTLCPTGCLLAYPGGPTTGRPPHLAGTSGWATAITGIY